MMRLAEHSETVSQAYSPRTEFVALRMSGPCQIPAHWSVLWKRVVIETKDLGGCGFACCHSETVLPEGCWHFAKSASLDRRAAVLPGQNFPAVLYKHLRHNPSRFTGSGYLLKCHGTARCLAC
jgi:hypothetical protein